MTGERKTHTRNELSDNSKEQTISTKDGKRYVRESLENAKRFLMDAKVLIESGSFAHGAALATLGIEESVKAKIAVRHLHWDGSFEVDAKTYRKEIKNHFSKLSLAATDYATNEILRNLIPEGSCSWEELYQRVNQALEKGDNFLRNVEVESYLYACLTILKEKWLYVDLIDGEVMTPLTWDKEGSEKTLSMARKIFEEYEADILRDLPELENEMRT